MINYKRSNDIRHGIILKENGEPNIGIFHGSNIPSIVDDGAVPQGSIYLRFNGEIYRKIGLLSSDWILYSQGSNSISQAQILLSRDGSVHSGKWLKIDSEVTSNYIGFVSPITGTSLNLTLLSSSVSTGTLSLYSRLQPSGYSIIGSITMSAISKVSKVINTPIPAGCEIAAKVTSGVISDAVLFGVIS